MIKVEYTIEPFVAGDIPARVTLAAAAIEEMGIAVDIGVFGSSFETEQDKLGEAVSRVVTVAYANGATHVTIDIAGDD